MTKPHALKEFSSPAAASGLPPRPLSLTRPRTTPTRNIPVSNDSDRDGGRDRDGHDDDRYRHGNGVESGVSGVSRTHGAAAATTSTSASQHHMRQGQDERPAQRERAWEQPSQQHTPRTGASESPGRRAWEHEGASLLPSSSNTNSPQWSQPTRSARGPAHATAPDDGVATSFAASGSLRAPTSAAGGTAPWRTQQAARREAGAAPWATGSASSNGNGRLPPSERRTGRHGMAAAWSLPSDERDDGDVQSQVASETSFLLTRSQWERERQHEEEELEEFEQLESIVTPTPAAAAVSGRPL